MVNKMEEVKDNKSFFRNLLLNYNILKIFSYLIILTIILLILDIPTFVVSKKLGMYVLF